MAVTPGTSYSAFSTADVHAPASNTAAVVTYTANASAHNVITGVAWSYTGGTPVGGNLKIENGSGTTVFTMDIPAAGNGVVTFPLPTYGTINRALIVTLAAGGSGVSGKLSVLGHFTV